MSAEHKMRTRYVYVAYMYGARDQPTLRIFYLHPTTGRRIEEDVLRHGELLRWSKYFSNEKKKKKLKVKKKKMATNK